MPQHDSSTERFGGPGSSHQDRAHPGKNNQPTGNKHRAGTTPDPAPAPGAPTNRRDSNVSGGGGERDSHHTHTSRRS